MSEHITHIAVYEDCARLSLHSKRINEAFKASLREFPDMGLLASASRGNHLIAVPIIEQAKALSARQTNTKENKMKLAAAVGWIAHRAADLQTKPLVKKYNPGGDKKDDESENEIYHDAVTWDKVYGGGKTNSISPEVWFSPAVMEEGMKSHPAASAINVDETELLFSLLIKRSLLEQHNFMRQEKDLEKWLANFFDNRQHFSEDFRVYIEAYQNPAPEKMKRYIQDVNFYNEQDELIRLARSLQQGKAAPGIDLDTAFEKAKSQSHYAQALRRGMHSMFTASAYYEDKVTKEALYDAMEIEKQSRI
jgi:hypothetical protein